MFAAICSQLMKQLTLTVFILLALSLGAQAAEPAVATRPEPTAARGPNILIILADDMGYGDPTCFNPQSKIPTPNIDRLARQGMRFTDAHAPGSVCVPSRYGLMTGRYPLRMNGSPYKKALIERGRVTIASLLHDRGYITGMIGKWHLGFDGGSKFDYSKPLRGGPVDHGFDYFFGQHASLGMPPYFFIENDRCVGAPTGRISANDTLGRQGPHWLAGDIAPGFKLDEVLPTFTRKAIEHIDQLATAKKPFLLYVALPAPHTPWLPTEAFRGKSACGLYGDWVSQVDDTVGQVLAALDRSGTADNTLVFFTSDNGPVWYPTDVQKYAHSSSGVFRGMKQDAWEGGHRMPFIARWPGKIKPDSVSTRTLCFTDLLATFAAVTDTTLPAGAGEDSISFLPELLGEKQTGRESLVQGWKDSFSIRRGDWKLIPFLGSGGFSKPRHINPGPGKPAGQLYNLAADPGETKNLYAEYPEVVKELTTLLKHVREQGKARP